MNTCDIQILVQQPIIHTTQTRILSLEPFLTAPRTALPLPPLRKRGHLCQGPAVINGINRFVICRKILHHRRNNMVRDSQGTLHQLAPARYYPVQDLCVRVRACVRRWVYVSVCMHACMHE